MYIIVTHLIGPFLSCADELTALKEDLLSHYVQFEESILTTVDDFKCKQQRYLKEFVSTPGNNPNTLWLCQCNVMIMVS